MKQSGKNVSAIESRGALIILSMLANADAEIIKNKLNLLVQVGLGPRWKEDEYIARYTCIGLQKLAKKPTRKSKDDKAASVEDVYAHNRLKSNHPIFQKLSDLVKDNTITW